jgi:hypothetical protein
MKFTLVITLLTAAIALPSIVAVTGGFRCLGPTEECPQLVPCCPGTHCKPDTNRCVRNN